MSKPERGRSDKASSKVDDPITSLALHSPESAKPKKGSRGRANTGGVVERSFVTGHFAASFRFPYLGAGCKPEEQEQREGQTRKGTTRKKVYRSV